MNVGVSLLTIRPGRIGGSETYVLELLRAMASMTGADEVTVMGSPSVVAAYRETLADCRLTEVKGLDFERSTVGRVGSLIRAVVGGSRGLSGLPPDLDVVHYPVAVRAPRLPGRSVVTLHDVQHRDMPEHFSRAQRAYRAVMYDRLNRSASVIITVSDYARERIVETLDIAPRRVVAIPHGVNHDLFRPGRGDGEVAAWDSVLPERFVYYPANAWPHKNHLRLLEAMARLRDTTIHLVLTGQRHGRDAELAAAAKRCGVENRVHHLGYVSTPTVAALYRRAEALVFPSLYEGFGAPPLEAMASGTPVVCAASASLPEVCGDAAIMIDPRSPESIADGIDRVAADAALQEVLAGKGLARASGFSWANAAARHLEIYRAMVADGLGDAHESA